MPRSRRSHEGSDSLQPEMLDYDRIDTFLTYTTVQKDVVWRIMPVGEKSVSFGPYTPGLKE